MKLLKELIRLSESADPKSALLIEIAEDAATQAMMYRGTRNIGDVVRLPVRKDRRPLDTSNLETALFNLEVEKMFGVRNIRSQVAFASANYVEAANYGSTVYSIFPPRDCRVLFDPSVPDSGYVLGHFGSIIEFMKFPEESYAAIKGMPVSEPEQIVEAFLAPATEELRQQFQEARETQFPKIMAGFQFVNAAEVPFQTKSCEYMILADEVYGISAQYIRENTPAEGTIHTRAVALLQQSHGNQ